MFTRSIEFDYLEWIANAFIGKIGQGSIHAEQYLSTEQRHQWVLDYLEQVRQARDLGHQIKVIYADPEVIDPETASADLRQKLLEVEKRKDKLQPIAEAILQSQVSQVVKDSGLTPLGGQPIPPVLYHATPLPMALIVSPRNEIRQDADISLEPDLTIDQIQKLEQIVAEKLDVSSLVVNIGGVGVYPTMVYESSNLDWLSEVVSHEWIHNFLSLRPLGVNYMTSPELRIINETTASIAGKEIGREVLERYYPELVPPPPATPAPEPTEKEKPTEPVFDFNKEMHTTRVKADELLAEGKISEAEDYMEQRRQYFWDNGYLIRKLNQAYFAFYGAYADQPGGAAGEDPVGEAVRTLRQQSGDLAEFLNRISWMYSFEQLQRAVK